MDCLRHLARQQGLRRNLDHVPHNSGPATATPLVQVPHHTPEAVAVESPAADGDISDAIILGLSNG